MVRNHHNMGRRTLLDAFPDKVDAGLMHPVELLRPQQLSVAYNLTEVIHAFPHEILIVRVDPRPQRTQDKVGVVYADNLYPHLIALLSLLVQPVSQ